MLPVDEQQTYQGLIITRHHIVDSVSKAKAQNSTLGWEFQARTAPAWIRALENGHTIQPSLFIPKTDGSYTHDWQSGLWQLTNFICADGDHFLGVEKDDKGNEKHPNGIPPWTDKSVLGEKYPELKDDVYAVGESVSSMQTEPPHRRYRLIFLFDKPIKSVPHYKQILSTLAEKYPLISVGKRSPAQPVFGNARKDFREFYISDPSVILPLDDFPFIESTESAQNKAQGALKLDRPPQSLDEYLNAHRIENTPHLSRENTLSIVHTRQVTPAQSKAKRIPMCLTMGSGRFIVLIHHVKLVGVARGKHSRTVTESRPTGTVTPAP